MLVGYYLGLFSSSNPLLLDLVLNVVEPRVSPAMNDDLDRPFEASEVLFALEQMDSTTGPGSDGLPPLFCKQFWDKVGAKVSDAVLSVLNSGIIPRTLNHTFFNSYS